MNFIAIALAGFEAWAAKPHNAKWFRRIEGTPIPNDLPVCIAQAFSDALAARSAPEAGKAVDMRSVIHRVLCDYRLSNFVFEGEGDPYCLVDMVTPDGRGINEGEDELFLLADEIAASLASSPAPTGAEDDSDLPTAEDVRGILGPTKGCPL